MAKPSITKRTTKGAALTYSELDTNFQNLKDATVSVTAGSGGTAVNIDLNGNLTLIAGTGISLSGNNTTKEITITNTGGGGGGTTVYATSFGAAYDTELTVDAFVFRVSSSSSKIQIKASSGISPTAHWSWQRDSSASNLTPSFAYASQTITSGSWSDMTGSTAFYAAGDTFRIMLQNQSGKLYRVTAVNGTTGATITVEVLI